ncbi:MAG: hypothetical protein ABIP68_01145 [Ferruginibacter sp.]
MSLDEYFIDIKKHTKFSIKNEAVFNNLEYIIAEVKANTEFINRALYKLNLKLNIDMEMNENSSPVCYANSPELREEFRTEIKVSSISRLDILFYIYSSLNSERKIDIHFKNLSSFKFPDNKDDFFNSVEKGKELLKNHLTD